MITETLQKSCELYLKKYIIKSIIKHNYLVNPSLPNSNPVGTNFTDRFFKA